MRLLSILGSFVALSGCVQTRSNVRRLNPPTLYTPPGYTHVVTANGGRTIFVSAQAPVDKDGKVVGVGDFSAQARQVFENIKAALAAALSESRGSVASTSSRRAFRDEASASTRSSFTRRSRTSRL